MIVRLVASVDIDTEKLDQFDKDQAEQDCYPFPPSDENIAWFLLQAVFEEANKPGVKWELG